MNSRMSRVSLASATFRSTRSSSALGSRSPGVQIEVIRIASKPASLTAWTRWFAAAASGCRVESSTTPTRKSRSPLPPPQPAASARTSRARARPLSTAAQTSLATVAEVAADLEQKLKSVPARPGVYIFRDAGGRVLYIGKAKSLRPRVRSYFQRGIRKYAQAQLPERIADLEVIVTTNEVEALHLEQNLVKRHRPPFNVRLRDDKSFPYIAVTVNDDYPRVMFTRERHRRANVYFGPYANAKKVRETLDVLNRVFQFRPCEGPTPGRHSGTPCLDFHIELCTAPCIGALSKEDYRALIDGVIGFLGGDTRTITRTLEREMKAAAGEERYEDAARYRNRLQAIESLAARQGADKR